MTKVKISKVVDKYCLLDSEDWIYLRDVLRVRQLILAGEKRVYCSYGPAGRRKTGIVSRLVMRYTGPMLVDHKDGDVLNNQKSNLRLATKRQNHANSSHQYHRRSYSKFRGVSYSHSNKGYTARIKRRDGVYKHLGTFKSQEEAAIAYNAAAKIEYGEFAFINPVS